MTRSWRGVVVPITTPKEMRIVAEDGGLCFTYVPYILHCIPTEDLLPQRKNMGSWESLFNSRKVISYFSKVVHILFWSKISFVLIPTPCMLSLRQ
jgi:hypothetical protein